MTQPTIARFAWLIALAVTAASSLQPAHAQTTRPATAPAPILIDFSFAGHRGGGEPLPAAPAVLLVRPTGNDDTANLQAAIDAAATAAPAGTIAALQLADGEFRVGGQLRITRGSIVLRGSTDAAKPTTIVATGHSRRTLIEVGNPSRPQVAQAIAVTGEKVPAGASSITLERVDGLVVGDRVVVTRPSTREWIAALKMNAAPGSFADMRLHWTPGSRDLVRDRTITAIDPAMKQITLDAPITTTIESRYGGGTVAKVASNPPIANVGLEHLVLDSAFDAANPKDEEHAWIGIAMDGVEDAWVRNVTAKHFVGSAIRVGHRARRITIEQCRNEHPISEVGGYRRHAFLVEGQQVLVRQCTSESGVNDFAIGLCASGPNVFLDCIATNALGASGSYESWASGVLYDRVTIKGAALRLTYDMDRAQAGGWTAANSVIYNSNAKSIEATGPEDAPNVVIDEGDRSLYEQQLSKRRGKLPVAAEVVPSTTASLPEFRLSAQTNAAPATQPAKPLQIVNGRFVTDGRTLWGGAVNDAWWLGQTSPGGALNAGTSITRFVPGRVGPGLTEDLQQLAEKMAADGTPFYQSGPGLWYDRRRDDHTITQRTDANVWAPFYELPWARSGQSTAWDGLSKYDLTKFNPWYFDRQLEFARLAARNGLVVFHSLYNTHNLLEIGPHWIDYPGRPANNINDTRLPEPPPLEPRDRLHVANQFYSVEYPPLREIHRMYITHVLDVLGREPNVVFSVAFQFSGPMSCQEFFQDTVAEWEAKNGVKVKILLCTSKDITDAILSNPKREAQVAAIDMRYWQYKSDGTLWAPVGGRNLAFREMVGQDFGRATDAPPNTTPYQVYRQIREYRDRFPQKAMITWNSGAGPLPILMAGGAQALMRNPTAGHGQGRSVDRTPYDAFHRAQLADVLMKMSPRDNVLQNSETNWAMATEANDSALIYSTAGPSITLTQPIGNQSFNGVRFDPRTGNTRPVDGPVSLAAGSTIRKPTEQEWLLVLKQ